MIKDLLTFLWPLYITNMALNFLYPLRTWWPRFEHIDLPIDGGLHFVDGKPILGRSTTVPGLFLAFMLGIIFVYIFGSNHGFFAALLTYIGHAAGSFIKRRLGVAGGRFLPIVDHGDYVILAGIVFVWCGYISFQLALVSIVVTLIVHPLVCIVGHILKIKKDFF